MRNYKEMIESGDWPPTNRETIRMMVGGVLGFVIGFAFALVITGHASF